MTINEKHDYDYKHKTIWRDNQEYVLIAYIETGYTLTKTTEGTYKTDKGESLNFKEITTETMTRDMSVFDAPYLPEDWQGELKMVDSETISRSTVREGGKSVADNMPAYSPPFDSKITKTFTRDLFGRGLLCNETEETYEARQIGTISPVKKNGENIPYGQGDKDLAIQTHSTPEWVLVKNYKTYYDRYDKDGEAILSTHSEYSDDGAEWLTAHALSDTGDENINEYQKAYAKFSQHSNGLGVDVGSSSITQAWQFVELTGRTKGSRSVEEGKNIGNTSDWYDNGAFVSQAICPFYNETNKACNIWRLGAYENHSEGCMHKSKTGTPGWTRCARAYAALQLAQEQDTAQVDTVIIGMASIKDTATTTPAAGYQRDIYIDELLNDNNAQSIANTIAQNILNVKGIKGIRKSVTIPYNPNIQLNGSVVEVSHDWGSLQTSISYLTTGDIPEFMISQSISSIASFVATRENARSNIPKYGSVVSANDNNDVLVKIGNSSYKCTTKLRKLSQGDIVLVSFAAGNKLRGQVIARL